MCEKSVEVGGEQRCCEGGERLCGMSACRVSLRILARFREIDPEYRTQFTG